MLHNAHQAFVAVALSVATLCGQTASRKTDFSGAWKCDLQATRIQKGLDLEEMYGGWANMDIVHRDPEVQVTMISGQHKEPFTLTMRSDGETRKAIVQGNPLKSRAFWQDTALVISWTRKTHTGLTSESRRTLRMSPDGKTIQADLENTRDGQKTVASEVWKKQ